MEFDDLYVPGVLNDVADGISSRRKRGVHNNLARACYHMP